jgi:hypothetical protein
VLPAQRNQSHTYSGSSVKQAKLEAWPCALLHSAMKPYRQTQSALEAGHVQSNCMQGAHGGVGKKSCSKKSSRTGAMRQGTVACSRKRMFICAVHPH